MVSRTPIKRACSRCGFIHPGDGSCFVTAPEHEFTALKREEWEQVVFEQASYFTVIRCQGRVRERQEFRDLLLAITEAVHGVQNPVPMVYAITSSGRSVMLPKDQWVRLLNEYAARVQRL